MSYTSYFYCHSVDCRLLQTLSLCLSVCVCVCLAFMSYILLTMGRILFKLGEYVGTVVYLIVLKFHKKQFSLDNNDVIPVF